MKKQIQLNEELIDIDIIEQNPKFVLFNLDGVEYAVNLSAEHEGMMTLNHNGLNHQVNSIDTHFVVDGVEFAISAPKRGRKSASKGDGHHQMVSPMPGKILKVFVEAGAKVEVGSPILVMEAMKMEHTIRSNKKGIVEALLAKVGDQVHGGVELVKIGEIKE
jgi:3-methylcrotonyl-CoA carboxylase alpha subunit